MVTGVAAAGRPQHLWCQQQPPQQQGQQPPVPLLPQRVPTVYCVCTCACTGTYMCRQQLARITVCSTYVWSVQQAVSGCGFCGCITRRCHSFSFTCASLLLCMQHVHHSIHTALDAAAGAAVYYHPCQLLAPQTAAESYGSRMAAARSPLLLWLLACMYTTATDCFCIGLPLCIACVVLSLRFVCRLFVTACACLGSASCEMQQTCARALLKPATVFWS